MIIPPPTPVLNLRRGNPSKRLRTVHEAAKIVRDDDAATRIMKDALFAASDALHCQLAQHRDEPVAELRVRDGVRLIEIPGRVASASLQLPRDIAAKALEEILGDRISLKELLVDRYGSIPPPTPLFAVELADGAKESEVRLERIESIDIREETQEEVKRALQRISARGTPDGATHVRWKIGEKTRPSKSGQPDRRRIYPRFFNAALRGMKDQNEHVVKYPVGRMCGLVAVVGHIRFELERVI